MGRRTGNGKGEEGKGECSPGLIEVQFVFQDTSLLQYVRITVCPSERTQWDR